MLLLPVWRTLAFPRVDRMCTHALHLPESRILCAHPPPSQLVMILQEQLLHKPSYGIVATIDQITPQRDVVEYRAKGEYRCRITTTSSSSSDRVSWVHAERIEDVEHVDKKYNLEQLEQELIAQVHAVKNKFVERREVFEHAIKHREQCTPGEFTDLVFGIVTDLALSGEITYLVKETNVARRMILVTAILRKLGAMQIENNASKLDQDLRKIANHTLRFDYGKFLEDKFANVETALGYRDSENPQEMFTKKLDAISAEETTRVFIKGEIKKLEHLKKGSSSYAKAISHLDWLTSLPWGKYTKDNLDIDHAKKILDEEHHGMDEVKNAILEFIAISSLKGDASSGGKILCLAGPPGVGKTSICSSLAKALERKFFRYSVGGLSDASEIFGHRRTYQGSLPGKIIQAIRSCESSNPVIVLDEIDKVNHVQASSALLEVLDPSQNKKFYDHYLDVPFDLSNVLFIATANYLENIPPPLLDRLDVIEIPGYLFEEKSKIAKDYIFPKCRDACGLKTDQIKLSDNAIELLVKKYSSEPGVRELQRYIDKLCRTAAFKIARKTNMDVSIEPNNLIDFVGQPRIRDNDIYTDDYLPVGIVPTLNHLISPGKSYVESLEIGTGTGESPLFKSTGAMNESLVEFSSLSLSFAKIFAEKKNFMDAIDFFEQKVIHLHYRFGKYDDSSSSLAIITSLLSLALNQRIYRNVAMAGEVTLHGKILKVDKIKDRFVAAKALGYSKIILPRENFAEIEALPESVKSDIECHLVDDYDQVFNIVFTAANANTLHIHGNENENSAQRPHEVGG